ncbi:hypothetical protein BRC83_02310 [Halobacteriales archaeon QS_1_68_17]|nr:MAG: hypothetical protein BRC83_02310 [Halobacteriales archaeon QS_1_68_17]
MIDPGDQIDTLRDRIQESEEISDEDRDALLDFSDHLYLLQVAVRKRRPSVQAAITSARL